MESGISHFRSSEALGGPEVFRNKCRDGQLRLELLEINGEEARGPGMDLLVWDSGRRGGGGWGGMKRLGLGVWSGGGSTCGRLREDRDEEQTAGVSVVRGFTRRWEYGLQMTMRNNKDKLHPLVLRCRECENKQPPLRELWGGGGSGPEGEETFQEEVGDIGECADRCKSSRVRVRCAREERRGTAGEVAGRPGPR